MDRRAVVLLLDTKSYIGLLHRRYNKDTPALALSFTRRQVGTTTLLGLGPFSSDPADARPGPVLARPTLRPRLKRPQAKLLPAPSS